MLNSTMSDNVPAPDFVPDHDTHVTTPADLADLLLDYLEQLGIDHVFGVPGGAIEPLYDALARHRRRGGRISHILARHEAGAAFMADGYARQSGKLGVCVSTAGPGATNLITAVATAYANNIALLVITGQPALASFGRHTMQESSCTGVDVLAMLRHCTRYNTLLSHPQQLERKLIAALQHATREPRGPVHLSVPVDVFRAPAASAGPGYDLTALLRPSGLVDHDTVEALCALLATCRHVVILIGDGCAGAITDILRVVAQTGATFVTTPDGKGLIDPRHARFRGVFGFAGHAAALAALRAPTTDLILAAGTSMGEWNTAGWCDSLLNERLVHIDQSDEHLARTPMARLHLRGDIKSIFARLAARLAARGATPRSFDNDTAPRMLAAPRAFDSDALPIKPQRLMRELGRLFPAGTRYLADTGNSVAWATHYLRPPAGGASEGWLRLTTQFVPMGWAIGAAIGTAAALAAGHGTPAPVVCITGDGSMLMNGQELSVAVAQQLCVVFVVLNDDGLGMVKHGQRLGGAEPIGFALPPTDFAMLARALGGRGHRIDAPSDLAALDMDAICAYRGPTLLDVHIDAEEVPPMQHHLRLARADPNWHPTEEHYA